MLIKLTQNKSAMVDAADAELALKFKWYYLNGYAVDAYKTAASKYSREFSNA